MTLKIGCCGELYLKLFTKFCDSINPTKGSECTVVLKLEETDAL